MKTFVLFVGIIGLLASFATAGTLYIEAAGGDGPLQPGQEIDIAVYAEEFGDFAGLQIALQFIGHDGPSDAFTIAETGDLPPRKIVHNYEVFPEIAEFGFAVKGPSTHPSPEPGERKPGDANRDGTVDVLDLVVIRNVLNQDPCTGSWLDYDVNDDGTVNILDVIFARNRLELGDSLLCGFMSLERYEVPDPRWDWGDFKRIAITGKTWLMTVTYAVGENPPPYCIVRPDLDHTVVSDGWGAAVAFDVRPARLTIGDAPPPGRLIIEGPEQRGEWAPYRVPDGFSKCRVTLDIYGEGFAGLGRAQTRLRFLHPDDGEAPFTLERVTYNEAVLPERFGVADPEAGIAGFVKGDVTMDCVVNILDLIEIRNHMNVDPTTGENWGYDVNQDGRVNIMDLITTRNLLNTKCNCE